MSVYMNNIGELVKIESRYTVPNIKDTVGRITYKVHIPSVDRVGSVDILFYNP